MSDPTAIVTPNLTIAFADFEQILVPVGYPLLT